MEVTSVEAANTSMEPSVEDFVEATSSMEAFAKASMEACVSFSLGSFHTFHESFHGSFHELPRKNQVVQKTTSIHLLRTCTRYPSND